MRHIDHRLVIGALLYFAVPIMCLVFLIAVGVSMYRSKPTPRPHAISTAVTAQIPAKVGDVKDIITSEDRDLLGAIRIQRNKGNDVVIVWTDGKPDVEGIAKIYGKEAEKR